MATTKNFPITEPLWDSNKTMKALAFFGKEDVRMVDHPRPLLTEPTDAIIRVTSTTVCGSDLHLYHNEFAGMEKGDILGHESMGIITDIGPAVKDLKVGDRVVVSFCIADGKCEYCKSGRFSNCDNTNPSKQMEEVYGHRTAGLFGYSHLTGGYPGGQAEYLRVPLADVNCLNVSSSSLPDEKLLFLSDILCTGWHANVIGEVKKGDVVIVWGLGPVGLMAMALAKFRGAERVIGIDGVDYRLDFAKEKLNCEVIDFTKSNVLKTIQQLVPGGPDVCIDAAAFRYSKSLPHKLQRAVGLETDTPEILTEAIMAVKKGGRISIVGDYYATANAFPIGAFMEKGLSMAAGQTYVQKYWKELLGYVERGEFDPTFVITHSMNLENADEAYRIFDQKQDHAIKIILKNHNVEGST